MEDTDSNKEIPLEKDEEDVLSGDEHWLVEDETSGTSIIDIFDPESITHSSLKELFDRATQVYSFDLKGTVFASLKKAQGSNSCGNLDAEYTLLKILNYVRFRTVKDGLKDPTVLKAELEKLAFEEDRFLTPVVPDDPLLYLFQDILEQSEGEYTENADKPANLETILDTKDEEIRLLRSHIKKLSDSLSTLTTNDMDKPIATKTSDEEYFESYGGLSIHREMLQDTARTLSYRDAIAIAVKGKTVLDIGCGTGILSLFSARAGAKSVLGVDASEIVHKAKEIVKANKYENIVTIVKGKVEDDSIMDSLSMSPGEKVDVLVSEWMGYGLLFESMLDSVLVARDRFLDKESGIMIPSHASIFVQGCSRYEPEGYEYWNDVYGFDYTALKEFEKKERVLESVNKNKHEIAYVTPVNHTSIISDRALVREFNLMRVQISELDFKNNFSIVITGSGKNGDPVEFNSVVISFDCKMFGELKLSTATDVVNTHWHQTMLRVHDSNDEPFLLHPGEIVSGSLAYDKSKENQRHIMITLTLDLPERLGVEKFVKTYELC
mmetsp:Transcript_12657/g.16378  ORF Transcript_12657/g.16378 Transcript_12657/m.16378 type:complete len:551 (+) Transcript_12657:137-1789(+)